MARSFARSLGYSTELFSLFNDMTSRDLLQRRATSSSSTTTTWEDTPLVTAAKRGHVVVLDGIHRLRSDTLGFLQRFLQDRELELFDGTKLIDAPRFAQRNNQTTLMTPIHPAFRVIALAEPPTPEYPWMTSETLAMFRFHSIPELPREELKQIIAALHPHVPPETIE